MNESYEGTCFAAAGDVHGYTHALVDLVCAWEQETGDDISFVLQVGDFEPHRDLDDLRTMAAPMKYKELGAFHEYFTGRATFPWPVYFVGGNHEPYGFLGQHPQGAWLVPNCRYLGRVGVITLAGLRVVFLTGIYREKDFRASRPSVDQIERLPNKRFTAITEEDVVQALSYESADILLLHDWPTGIVAPGDEARFERKLRHPDQPQFGNPYARILIDLMHPQLVLCGHMHIPYEREIETSNGLTTKICCLGRADRGRVGLAVFRITSGSEMEPVNDRPGGDPSRE